MGEIFDLAAVKMDNLSIISFSILIKLICSSTLSGDYQGGNSGALLSQADGKFMNAFREKFFSEKKIDRILDKMLKLIQKQFIRLRTKKSFSSLRVRNDDENAIEETFKMMALLRKLMTSSGSIKKK